MESNNLVDIPEYEGIYKFDIELNQVYSIKRNKYLKNRLSKGYFRVGLCKNGKEKTIYLYRLIYIINNPTEDITGFDIDHIDGNPLNNNIDNLRKCSRSDNCSNTKTQKNNKSTGIKNISKTEYDTYKFNLKKNGIYYSKTFKTIEEAIEYRDKFVFEKCGEFANLG